MNKFTEMLTTENAVLAIIDHQTGLLVSCRDLAPHSMTKNINDT